jgi:8-oxo-dGTP pyrophosphatase MutT (NUDIX family)
MTSESSTPAILECQTLARSLARFGTDALASPEGTRRAAVAILLRFDGSEPHVLLMTRAQREGDRWSGQVGLPGGHEEPLDEDLVATVVRETLEELGFDLSRHARLMGALPPTQARARAVLLPMWIHPLVFERTSEHALEPGSEASDAFWFPLGLASSGALDSEYRFESEGPARTFPCWLHEGRVVWGLTYRMLRALLDAWLLG